MKAIYEVGRVYIWQGLKGSWAYLNGTETTVVTKVMRTDRNGKVRYGHGTTTTFKATGKRCIAQAGMLRPKRLSAGEQLIADILTGKRHVNEGELT